MVIENNYFGRNMHKNALFLLKNGKNRPALGAPPPNPRQPLLIGISWQRQWSVNLF